MIYCACTCAPSPLAGLIPQGLLSPDALQIQARLGAMHPVEALGVIAAVIQSAAECADAASGGILAQVQYRRASIGNITFLIISESESESESESTQNSGGACHLATTH